MRRRTWWALTLGIFISFSIRAQNSDCPGAGICSNQSGTLTTGVDNELNAANSGCLPDYEANYSFWFNICTTTSGTICFTINPNGSNNDYDFAVWGPNVFCMPTVPPIRCSYAVPPPGGGSNGDVTGLGNGAADNAEGPTGNSWLAPINALAGECYLVYVANYHTTVSTFDLIFTGTANYNCAILPVEITSFSASEAMNGVDITWNCQSETNNSHFIVERTLDGNKYEFVSQIQGAGTTTQATQYSVTDPAAEPGINYYRIRQVDYNGQEKIYGPISCEYNVSGPSFMEITNMNGQIIFSGETNNYNETMQDQNLTSGFYLVTLTRGNSRQTFRHVVTSADPAD